MKLVEIIRHTQVSDPVVNTAIQFGKALEKEMILVKDSPGFVTTRLSAALFSEAIRLLDEGVASQEDIDKAMVLGYNHPIGPFRLADFVGLDVRMNVIKSLHEHLGRSHFAPSQRLQTLIDKGDLGRKTGKGFYDWQN